MRGQDFLFSLTKEYPRREQVMQYGEDDLHFITRLLGEVGIWFRFTTDTRLNIDVVEFYDSQQGYEKGLTLPSVPPSGSTRRVWTRCGGWKPSQRGAEAGQHPRLQLPSGHGEHEYSGGRHPGDATTYGEAYHYADNYLTPGSAYDLNPAPESGAFYARIRHERYLNGQTQTRASPAVRPSLRGGC
jgi:type VI secretion system secreted protein VgrG